MHLLNNKSNNNNNNVDFDFFSFIRIGITVITVKAFLLCTHIHKRTKILYTVFVCKFGQLYIFFTFEYFKKQFIVFYFIVNQKLYKMNLFLTMDLLQ